MLVGGILLSFTILGFAGWLHWNEHLGWPNENLDVESDQAYLSQRRRTRGRVNAIFAFCGLLILVASISGPGIMFVSAWTCVAFGLMTAMVLALLDGFRAHHHHSRRLPKTRQQLLDSDDS